MSEPMVKKQKTFLEEILTNLKEGTSPTELKEIYSPSLVDSALEVLQPQFDTFVGFARNGELDKLEKMMQEEGISIHVKDRIQSTALVAASYKGHLDILKFLLKAGAKVNVKNYLGSTAVELASQEGYLEIVETLLKAGADFNHQNDKGWTPLMSASIAKGSLEIVETLLQAGADINIKDKKGNTVLIAAAHKERFDIVKTLLKTGANFNVQNNEGWTPLLTASFTNKGQKIVETLLKAGADPNIKQTYGMSALMFAALKGDLEMIKTLLSFGADPTISDNDGKTADIFCLVNNVDNECKEILKHAMRVYSYNRQKKEKQIRGLIKVGTPKDSLPDLPIEVWTLILKRRIQLELCTDLGDNTNKETLLIMAEVDFGVPKQVIRQWRQEKSKKGLCKIVSGLLSIDAMYSEEAMEYLLEREKLQKITGVGLYFEELLKSAGINMEYEEEYIDEKTQRRETRIRKKTYNQLLEELGQKQRRL